ncbi:MAG: hypothetical protein ACLVLA_01225 [Acidaminococcus intestini]
MDNGEHAYQWDAWFDALQGVIERIPVAPLLGNHETYTLDWKVRRPLAYLQLFQLPAGDARYAGEFYSFDVGRSISRSSIPRTVNSRRGNRIFLRMRRNGCGVIWQEQKEMESRSYAP